MEGAAQAVDENVNDAATRPLPLSSSDSSKVAAERPPLFPDPCAVIDGALYLGSCRSVTADVMRKHGIRGVLNVASEIAPPELWKEWGVMSVLHLPLDDDEEFQLEPALSTGMSYLHSHIKEGRAVLVHCQAGVSRSAAFVLAYLMQHRGLTLKEAFVLVRDKRPVICPNEGFFAQLSAFEEKIYGVKSFCLFDYLLSVLVEMGFDPEQSKEALKKANNRFDLALSFL